MVLKSGTFLAIERSTVTVNEGQFSHCCWMCLCAALRLFCFSFSPGDLMHQGMLRCVPCIRGVDHFLDMKLSAGRVSEAEKKLKG